MYTKRKANDPTHNIDYFFDFWCCIPVQVRNIFPEEIETLGGLQKYTKAELLQIHGVGHYTADKIIESLHNINQHGGDAYGVTSNESNHMGKK